MRLKFVFVNRTLARPGPGIARSTWGMVFMHGAGYKWSEGQGGLRLWLKPREIPKARFPGVNIEPAIAQKSKERQVEAPSGRDDGQPRCPWNRARIAFERPVGHARR
jgi:hypothetical protein